MRLTLSQLVKIMAGRLSAMAKNMAPTHLLVPKRAGLIWLTPSGFGIRQLPRLAWHSTLTMPLIFLSYKARYWWGP